MVTSCSRVTKAFGSVPSLTSSAIAQARASLTQSEPVTVSPSRRARIAQTIARVMLPSGLNAVAETPSMRPFV